MHPIRDVQPARPTGRPGAVLLLMALLLAAGSFPARLLAADKGLPADLALVPESDAVFLSVRVADLVTSKPGKQFLHDLSKDGDKLLGDLQHELGVSPEEVERATLLPTRRILIVRTLKPYDREKLLETLVPGARRVQYHGKTGYEDQQTGVGVYLAGDRVFLKAWDIRHGVAGAPAAEEGSLGQLLELADKHQKPLAEALRLASEKHAVVIGVVPAAVLGHGRFEAQAEAHRAQAEYEAARQAEENALRERARQLKKEQEETIRKPQVRPEADPPGPAAIGPGPGGSGTPPTSGPTPLPLPPPVGGGPPLPLPPGGPPPGAGLPGPPRPLPLPPPNPPATDSQPGSSSRLAFEPPAPPQPAQDAAAPADKEDPGTSRPSSEKPALEAEAAAEALFDELPLELWPYKPLLQARSALLVVDVLDEELTAQARVTFAGEESARDGETAIKTGLYVLRQMLARGFEELAQKAELGKQAQPLLQRLQAALKEAPVKTEGTVVMVSAKLPVDAATLAGAVLKVRHGAERAQSINNLKQIVLAMHNFHDTMQFMPPATIYSKDGKPLLSWRVAILPYIEQQALYNQFKLDEPWDSPNNKPLLEKMPRTYAPVQGQPKEPYSTYYQVFVGPQTPFNERPDNSPPFGAHGPRLPTSFPDGTSNTLLIVEAGKAVPWSKPEDIPYDDKKPVPRLGPLGAGFTGAMADGSVHFFPAGIDEETLRNLIRPADGNPVDLDKIIGNQGKPGYGARLAPRPSVTIKVTPTQATPTKP